MASVSFRLKSPHLTETTIICRFYSRETGAVDLTTGESIPTEYWQGQRVSAKYKKNHDRINRYLSQLECDLLDIWRDNKGASKAVLKELITARVKGAAARAEEKKTVVDTLTAFIEQYTQEKDPLTVKVYNSLLRKLQEFGDLPIDSLDFNFYDKFKKFLYKSPNPVYAGYQIIKDDHGYTLTECDDLKSTPGLFNDTVYKYIIRLRTFLKWAAKRGLPVNPCYRDWDILRRDHQIISLTLDELKRIEALTALPPHLEIARDYFSICCRTGQRISDVKRINSLATSTGRWNILQKKGARQKQKIVELPLVGFSAPVIGILEKHGGVLPAISEQHLNKHIKELCKRAGITQTIYIERWQGSKKIRIPGQKYEFISLHSGKKTFITILGGQGVPVKVISDLTGTSIKTIEKHYLGKTDLYIVDSFLKKIDESTPQQQIKSA